MKSDRFRSIWDAKPSMFRILFGPAPGEDRDFELINVDELPRGKKVRQITDWAGPIEFNLRDRPRVGPVSHFRLDFKRGRGLSQWYHLISDAPVTVQVVNPVDTWIPQDWDYLYRLRHIRPPDSLVRDIGLEAFARFQTQFPEEVKIPNFFWELREIGELIPRLSATLSETAANGMLTYSFGWAPLLGDLKKLGNLCETVRARLKHLIDTWGRSTRLGYERLGCWTHELPDHHWYVTGSRGLTIGYKLGRWKTDIRVGGQLFHMLDSLSSIEGTIRAFIGALGLSNPAAVVWEALPFSFMADWFLNVSGYLDALAGFQDKTAEWDVYNVTWSMKTEFVVDVYQMCYPDQFEGGLLPERWIGYWHGRNYDRKLGYPTPQSYFPVGSLNPRQLSLMSALLLAK